MKFRRVVAVVVMVGCSGTQEDSVDQQAQTKLSPPAVTVVDTTATSMTVQVCAGPTGAMAGFTIQWISAAGLADGGWDANPERCDGSFSGNAQASTFALGPNQCTTLELGTNHVDAPGMTLSCGEVDCRQRFALRAFAHGYAAGPNVYLRSDYTQDVAAATQRCPRGSRDGRVARDVGLALGKLREAEAVEVDDDGVPQFLQGDLGQPGPITDDDPVLADQALRPALPAAVAPFRLKADALALRKVNRDDDGTRHFRYQQRHNGLDVIGGDLVVAVDPKGTITSVNGSARGDFPPSLGSTPVGELVAAATVAGDPRFTGMVQNPARTVYLKTADGDMYEAYEIVVEGTRGRDPVRDRVYVDVDTGAIVAVYPQIHSAENRKVYSANNGTMLPGTLKRSEGQAETTDIDVNAAYDNVGATYSVYKNMFNRDSYDNAGATLISTVHYDQNYCNAFWNGSQMVYGDGDPTQGCYPLARAVDVTGHELTHAVTENESNLSYVGESGGINESLSDFFGELTEAYVDGGSNGALTSTADNWLVGEDILPPFLRSMCDPAADNYSLDYWTSTTGNAEVHSSSGIGNLMFCLLAKGGHHPRRSTGPTVVGIGTEKAARIAYYAQTNLLISSSNYLAFRNAMVTAAVSLGFGSGSAEYQAVSDAFAAVGVGAPPPPPSTTILVSGKPLSNLSGAQGSQAYFSIAVPIGTTSLKVTISGGSGDADLYVKSGSLPTTTSYNCRPYLAGNNETCNITNPAAGTWYIMLRGYTAYSGVTLTATNGSAATALVNGVPVSGIAGASGSNQYWRLSVPAATYVTIRISGGVGDADLYTRTGALPTTSSFNCRPYLTGNNETCTMLNVTATDVYIMIRGYTSYSGVTLVGTY